MSEQFNEMAADLAAQAEFRAQHEPLQPDPAWQRGVNAPHDYRSSQGPSLNIRDFTPAAFERGFMAGAYALASHINALIAANDLEGIVKLVRSYEEKAARPTKGWAHETR